MEKDRSALSFVSQVTGKKKIYIAVLLLLQIVVGITSVLTAILLRGVIDEAVQKNTEGFVFYVVLYAGFVLIQILIHAGIRFLDEFSRSTYENLFKERLFGMLLIRDYKSVTSIHTGEWMNRLTSDTVVVADGFTTILPGIVGMLVKMLGALVMILWFEPRFAIILIPGGILLAVLTYGFRKILKSLHKKMQEKDGFVRTFLQENLGSLMVIKAFSAEQQSIKEAATRMGEHRKARIKRNHFSNICNVGFATAMQGSYVIGLIYCGYNLLMGTMSYGTLMAVLQLINQIQNPFANISGYLPRYYAMLASAERLMEVENFSTESEAILADGVERFDHISMKNVSFAYDDERKILHSFSMDISKGEFVAFTGESGCGKSTILRLLLGLYKPQSGVIEPIQRKLYAYVPQGNYLMSGTIREVITFADRTSIYDENKIRKALEIACAEFVYELPDALDTQLLERGLGLSEGQMQRLAIARAIFANRPVLILDEATSALDEVTERKVLERVRSMTDKTVLIVTHRPAALGFCDKQISLGKNWSEME